MNWNTNDVLQGLVVFLLCFCVPVTMLCFKHLYTLHKYGKLETSRWSYTCTRKEEKS